MEYVTKKIEGDTNKLLIGQFMNEKKCNIYFEYDLLNPLNLLLDDLSVKQQLYDFLNKIQDITSLISFGLKPVGLYFRGEMPEYCRNNSILKKICSVFDVDCLLLQSQNLKQCFSAKTITTTPANIKIVEQFDIIRIDLRTYLNFNLGEEIDQNQFIEKIKKHYENQALLYNNQILTQLQGKQMSLQFFSPLTQQVDCVQNEYDNHKILQGHLVVKLLVESSISIQELKNLILSDILQTLKVRIKNITQTPCYLPQRLLVTFKNTQLILQSYIDHQFIKQQEISYIKQYFPTLDVEDIVVLESQQNIELKQVQVNQFQPIETSIPQPQPTTQVEQPINQPQTQINQEKFKQEYLIMIAIVGLLIAIYLKTLF